MESPSFDPPKDTKIGSKNLRVREIKGKISVQPKEGNEVWFEFKIGRIDKLRA